MHEVSQSDIDTFYRMIGQNVMRLRKEKGMTQLDLALAMGLKSVGLISVAEIYHNKKHFNLEHLYKIAAVFGVEITDFFGGVDISSQKNMMKKPTEKSDKYLFDVKSEEV